MALMIYINVHLLNGLRMNAVTRLRQAQLCLNWFNTPGHDETVNFTLRSCRLCFKIHNKVLHNTSTKSSLHVNLSSNETAADGNPSFIESKETVESTSTTNKKMRLYHPLMLLVLQENNRGVEHVFTTVLNHGL